MRFFPLLRTLVVWGLLAGAVVFFSHRTYQVWHGGEEVVGAGPASAPPGRRPPMPRVPRNAAYHRPLPLSAYEVIPRRSLFSSDRSERIPETPTAALPVVQTRPIDARFTLYGVVVEGAQRRALVANLDKRNPTDPDQVWVEAGSVLGNLTVTEIGAAQIVVHDGTSAYVVRLSDRSSWKQPRSPRPARTGGTVQKIEVGLPGEKAIRPQGTANPPGKAPRK